MSTFVNLCHGLVSVGRGGVAGGVEGAAGLWWETVGCWRVGDWGVGGGWWMCGAPHPPPNLPPKRGEGLNWGEEGGLGARCRTHRGVGHVHRVDSRRGRRWGGGRRRCSGLFRVVRDAPVGLTARVDGVNFCHGLVSVGQAGVAGGVEGAAGLWWETVGCWRVGDWGVGGGWWMCGASHPPPNLPPGRGEG